MFANFYNENDKCLFSTEVVSERHAERLSETLSRQDQRIDGYTVTEKAIGKIIRYE